MHMKHRDVGPVFESERSAAQSFEDRVAEYNTILADQGQEAADVFAHEAMYASRTEYRQAR
jgi:hypothetical protein